MRCPDLKEIGESTTPCNNLPQEPGTPFVLIETLNDDENVIGEWREGSCDYASSAAAVECVDYACLLFYSTAAASGALRQC